MIINGKEVDFNIYNVCHAKKYETALQQLGVEEKKIKSIDNGNLSEVIERLIKMFRNFFVTATGVDVLEGCEDAVSAKQAYIEFLSEIEKQKKMFAEPFSLERIK